MKPKSSLTGVKVIVVEDEPLISMFIEDCLKDIGCEIVGTAANLPDAITKVSEVECDVIMLDLNLGGTQTITLAETLSAKRKPFIFSTGYGTTGIPSHLQNVPVLQKPFQEIELKEALSLVLLAQKT